MTLTLPPALTITLTFTGKYLTTSAAHADLTPCPTGTDITTELECREAAQSFALHNPFSDAVICAEPTSCRCYFGNVGS